MKEKKQIIGSFLGAGSRFNGELRFEGAMRVDTEVLGSIISQDGLLIVGEKALVDAHVRVAQLVVYGTVRGRVEAGARVEIKKSGRVEADVVSPMVTMEKGAVLCGNCEMKKNGAEEEKPVDMAARKTLVSDQ